MSSTNIDICINNIDFRMVSLSGNARSRNLLRRFGNVVEFPLQYLVVIVLSIAYLSFRFLSGKYLHVLNPFGSVYGEDDVSNNEGNTFFVKARCLRRNFLNFTCNSLPHCYCR